MKEHYRSIINAQGLQRLQVVAANPAARMGIGDDEEWKFYDMKVEYITKHTKVVIPDADSPAFINPISRQGNLGGEDFPMSQYIGEPVASFEGV